MNVIDTSNDDADVRAMRRSKRAPLAVMLAVVLGLPLLAGAYVLQGKAATADDLARQGFTDVKVEIDGPLSYRFTARKGEARCTGSVGRTPFSSHTSEGCFGR